jgi:hypothetical protein
LDRTFSVTEAERPLARGERTSRDHPHREGLTEIFGKALVKHLERAGFVVMKRPPIGGG